MAQLLYRNRCPTNFSLSRRLKIKDFDKLKFVGRFSRPLNLGLRQNLKRGGAIWLIARDFGYGDSAIKQIAAHLRKSYSF